MPSPSLQLNQGAILLISSVLYILIIVVQHFAGAAVFGYCQFYAEVGQALQDVVGLDETFASEVVWELLFLLAFVVVVVQVVNLLDVLYFLEFDFFVLGRGARWLGTLLHFFG